MRSSPRIRSKEELQLLIEKWAESIISKQRLESNRPPVTAGRLDQRLAGLALALRGVVAETQEIVHLPGVPTRQ